MPEISVIIPLYNKGPHITRTLNSVLAQSYQNFEIIVIDGGSTDNGPEIVKNFNDKRIFLFQQAGKGVSEARNQGVEKARADLIAFIDADDEWTPLHLETIIRLRRRFPAAGLYATAFNVCMPDGKIRMNEYRCIPDPDWEGILPDYFKSAALGDPPVQTCIAAIPKIIFLEVGGFPTGYWWGEDHDLFGKIALKYQVAFSWKVGGIYHTDAINRATDRTRSLDYEEPFVKTARDALGRGEVKQNLVESLNEYISRKEINRAMNYIFAGKSSNARLILNKCKTKYFYFSRIKLIIFTWLPYPLLIYIRNIKEK